MSHAFFSYSRKDEAFVLRLAQDLRKRDIPIWLDQLDIPAGSNWDESVQYALQHSATVLFLVSEHSIRSNNVLNEVNWAVEGGRRVVPLLITPGVRVPVVVSRLQRVDFCANYGRGLTQLVALMRGPGFRTETMSVLELGLSAQSSGGVTPDRLVEPAIVEAKPPVVRAHDELSRSKPDESASRWHGLLMGVLIGAVGIIVLFIVLAVVVDDEDEPSIAAPVASAATAADNATFALQSAAASAPPLVGRWLGECQANGGGAYARGLYIFHEHDGTFELSTYTDARCTQPLFVVNFEGRYTLEQRADGLHNVDSVMGETTLVPLRYAQALNLNGGLGYHNWQDGQARRLSDADVSALLGVPWQSGVTRYDIVSVKGNRLMFGAGSPAFEPDQRPTQLESTQVFVRQ